MRNAFVSRSSKLRAASPLGRRPSLAILLALASSCTPSTTRNAEASAPMEPPSPSAPGQSADTPRQTNAPSGPTPATLSALLKQAAGGRASFVRVADTTFVLRLTSPAEGSVVEELSWSSRDIDDRIYAARIDPLFADLRAGAPLRCEPRVLECIVSSESGAEIVYQFRETPAGARLAELRAPAWE